MKKAIKILVTYVILLLTSFTIYAQTDYWTGAWNTKFGKVTIRKNGDKYSGFFPKGQLTQIRVQDGALIGYYSRMVAKYDKSSLGKKGTFKFILSNDKAKFDGYHKSETDARWRSENWNGEKIWGTVMPVIVSNNLLTAVKPTWTGTWETDTFGRLKVWDTGTKYKNSKNAIRIEGRFFIKGGGDFIDIFDVEGYSSTSRPKVFKGSFNHNGRYGYFELKFGSPTDDDFRGYLNYNKSLPSVKPVIHEKRVYVKGKRTSSAKPNMNTY